MSKAPKHHTIDFETKPIEDRPHYPPEPVGLAIRRAGQRKGRYYAWGHPTRNNSTKEEARRALLSIWEDSHLPILAHNMKFDYEVAMEKMDLPPLPWDRMHDTEYLLFLHNPHAKTLSLKPASEEILGLPPEEQDAVRQWLIDHGVVRKDDKKWGAHISKAPGDIVGKYALGDLLRTDKLFDYLYDDICNNRGMLEAYNRERRLMPIMLDNERQGVRTDLPKLEKDWKLYVKEQERVDAWLRKRLRAPSLDFNKDIEVANALDRAGAVKEWTVTKTGRLSVAKDNLPLTKFVKEDIGLAYFYRNRLETAISTFFQPWVLQARENNGRLHTQWHQVRQEGRGGKNKSGTRTGRFSSSNPNFMNVPTEFDEDYAEKLRRMKKALANLLPLPFMRRYLLPDEGHVWLSRDYSQQEYRILAHYEQGSLLEAYKANPHMDIHDWLQEMLRNLIGLDLTRKKVKIVNFAEVYGLGEGGMAEKLDADIATVKIIKRAKAKLMTGLQPLKDEIKAMARRGEPITTWGGRQYYKEEPTFINGRWQDWAYKLPNYLIQGSAADCIKEATLRYNEARQDSRFLIQVHDELNISAPKKAAKKEMKVLREAMESVEFEVKMLSTGEWGPNWHDLEPFPEK